ncbi:hypothetical protein SODALDRAFT_332935 [Sodiomyces alkalinus F11]|uniref:Uncharacterized protein n=1 Tax=Sodiomyces alkalinus (strain CBS 110278 / VKM F-3762 / F11) TaxID=1314773 RepID=A0A3N2PV33_SODAK|nr:hypothetical protein SODALDRAFT_332935 [Sodiomyces alkalinus F11]ROT38367.1 hypothetical protein SODALDRAFT_332935 [Sodiomyces alkalinus F11]
MAEPLEEQSPCNNDQDEQSLVGGVQCTRTLPRVVGSLPQVVDWGSRRAFRGYRKELGRRGVCDSDSWALLER